MSLTMAFEFMYYKMYPSIRNNHTKNIIQVRPTEVLIKVVRIPTNYILAGKNLIMHPYYSGNHKITEI